MKKVLLRPGSQVLQIAFILLIWSFLKPVIARMAICGRWFSLLLNIYYTVELKVAMCGCMWRALVSPHFSKVEAQELGGPRTEGSLPRN